MSAIDGVGSCDVTAGCCRSGMRLLELVDLVALRVAAWATLCESICPSAGASFHHQSPSLTAAPNSLKNNFDLAPGRRITQSVFDYFLLIFL